MALMNDFQGKLAVVFGGGRDIGGAIATELARRGAQVSLSYHGSNPNAVVDTITELGHKPFAQKVDATDMTAVRAFAESSAQQAGKPISILINVVGGLVARKRMEEMDDQFWDYVMALNTKSIFAMTQAALPLMTDGASIVNVSSQAGRDGGGPGGIAYGAAKGALMSMTRGLAKELGPRRIRVNAVCPGMIATKFHDDFTKPEVRQRVAGMTPLGREGKAEEVANLVVYLASCQASFVNGANVDINGGILFS
jgi:3-oxoacyl-[acyl-carrier protein] reductase